MENSGRQQVSVKFFFPAKHTKKHKVFKDVSSLKT